MPVFNIFKWHLLWSHEAEVTCDETVTLLGINIDFKLKFDVADICKKASKQLVVFKGYVDF